MKRTGVMLTVILAVGIALGMFGSHAPRAAGADKTHGAPPK